MEQQIMYELRPIMGDGQRWNGTDLLLVSPALNRQMFSAGTVEISVEEHPGSERTRIVLDPFQQQSLNDFLRSQVKIQQILERELASDRGEIETDGPIWAQVQCVRVNFDVRRIDTPERRAVTKRIVRKITEEQQEKIAQSLDRPDTLSTFTITFRVDWDEEHWRVIRVRDLQIVSVSHE